MRPTSPNLPPVKTRPARKAPPPVRTRMTGLIAHLAQKSGALDPALITHWEEIVGPELAKFCRPVRLSKNRNARSLVVSVPNGGAAMKVQFAQGQILGRAAQHLGIRNVTRLQIEQSGGATTTEDAPSAPSRAGPRGKRPPRQTRWKTQAVTGNQLKQEAAEREAAAALRPAQSVDEALARLAESMRAKPPKR